MGLYFRGHTYENTLYNRIVANFLTFLYRSKIEIVYYVETYWLRFVLLVLLVLSLCACSSSGKSPLKVPHIAPDTCIVDSQCVHGHDYLIFYRPSKNYVVDTHLEPFQVLHSPDCYCRYNRKFIVIKRSK